MNQTISGNFVSLDHIYSEIASVDDVNIESTDNELGSEKMCPTCKKILPPNANLSFHEMLHPKTEKPYSCDHCIFICMSREELTQHCKLEHPSTRRFICAVCSKEFTNIRTLNKHKPTHALVLPFSCAYCDRGFPEYGYWRQHEVAHKTGRFECEDCHVRFTTVKFYNQHRDTEYCRTKVLECCDKVFPTRMDYVKHCVENHRFQKKDEYGCEFCGRLYAFRCLLNIHLQHCRLRKGNQNHNSSNNTKAVPNSDGIQNNDSTSETEIPIVKQKTDKGARQVYGCDLCNRTFLTKSWQVQHRRKHEDPDYTKYICSFCSKKYGSYSALYYHKQRIHLKIRRYKCSYCEKAYYDGQSLRDHVTSHTGERPYTCNYCPKKFRNRSSKIEHHRVHTGERPYHCRYCEQSFKRRDAKQAHERRHTGEKPYKCRVCDRCFAQDSTWRSHEKKHQPPFSCTICHEMFTCKESLVTHKASHDDPSESNLEQVFSVSDRTEPVEMTTDTAGNVYIQYQVV